MEAMATLALMLAWLGAVKAYPGYLTCDRSLEVGSEIMFNAAVQADGHGVTLAGLDCGGSYSPGDQISVDVTPPGGSFQYILEVSGAVLTHGEANCGGTRLVNQGSATLDTSASTGEISIWTAKGIGPSAAVQIHEKCTISAQGAASDPPKASGVPPPPPAGSGGGSTGTPPAKSPPPPSARPPPPLAAPPPRGAQTISSIETTVCFDSACNYQLKWTPWPETIELELSIRSLTWIALGTSLDGSMSSGYDGSHAFIVQYINGAFKEGVYHLKGRLKSQVKEVQDPIPEHTVERVDGFTRLNAFFNYTDNCEEAELQICKGKAHVIVAYGTSEELEMHAGRFAIRLQLMDDGDSVKNAADVEAVHGRQLSVLHIVHVLLMGMAWLGLVPAAIIVVKFKSCFEVLQLGKPAYWFVLHRAMQMLALLMTIIAGIIGLTIVEGVHFASTHAYLGVTTLAMAVVQLIIAFIRPGKAHKLRKLWEYSHKGLGYALAIFAIVTSAYGMVKMLKLTETQDLQVYRTHLVNRTLLEEYYAKHPPPPPPPPKIRSPPPRPSPLSSPPPPPASTSTSTTASHAEISEAVAKAASLIERIAVEESAGPLFVRLAWHDAGTYDKHNDLYGPRAAMRFAPESSNPSNNGLGRARALLEAVKEEVPLLGYADLWQLAAVVSIRRLGGPKVPFRYGRVDAATAEEATPPGMLVNGHDSADDLRVAFYRMGFTDREIVSLAGAHTLGLCHFAVSGYRGPWDETPFTFDNRYYVAMYKKEWTFDGRQHNADDDTMMLPSDLALRDDPGFAPWTRSFAENQELWFESFKASFQKLGELGWSKLTAVDYPIEVMGPALLPSVQKATRLVQEIVERQMVGPAFIRLAWHDAGTFNITDGSYGPRASMRFAPESENPSNNGLSEARQLLETVKEEVPELGYADLWQLAAVVSVRSMGGPMLPFRVGRVDADGPEDCAPPGMLVDAHDTADDLRDAFYRMGLTDRDIVALTGAHTVGRCHIHFSGFDGPWTTDQYKFDNAFYVDLLNKRWSFNGNVFKNSLNDETIMLRADMALLFDSSMSTWTEVFASDQLVWFSAFTESWTKLSENAAPRLFDAPVILSPPSGPAEVYRAHQDEVCVVRRSKRCVLELSWWLHDDDTATVTLSLSENVEWIALGVSAHGFMVDEPHSKVVVGTPTEVVKRTLMMKDLTSIERSAQRDEVQDLRQAAFARNDGFSTLTFRHSLSWFRQYADPVTGAVRFIYAHGRPDDASHVFSYHGLNRGRIHLSAFGYAITQMTPSLNASVHLAARMIRRLVEESLAGPTLIRLAWHDAGTYNKTDGMYGPRASMRFSPEADYPSNNGLDGARRMLEAVKAEVPELGYADLWQLAAVVSVRSMGGPVVPFRVGRVDADGPEDCAPPGMLVDAHDTADDLRDAFYRMGFNDQEMVALTGAHTVGRCHPHFSGFNGPWTLTPLTFANTYFVDMMNKTWVWDGNQHNAADATMMLASDLNLLNDTSTRAWVEAYAEDESLFFDHFARAFNKLGELGARGLAAVNLDWSLTEWRQPPLTGGAYELKQGLLLTWDPADDTDMVAVTLTLNAEVGWLALAVSASGRMIDEHRSKAIVGTPSGLLKRTLNVKDVTSPELSAVIDDVQDLQNASFTRADGETTIRFTYPLAWFRQYTPVNEERVWLIFAHGPRENPAAPFSYHGLNRGQAQVPNFGARVASSSPPPPSPPESDNLNLQISNKLRLTVTVHDDHTATATLTLSETVPWLGFAVSHSGRMVLPEASRAVVGTPTGVLKRRLRAKDLTSVSRSTEVELNQDLIDSSFVSIDGVSTLRFRTTVDWFKQFANGASDVWFLYAHGELGLATGAFGFHGQNKGSVFVPSFVPSDTPDAFPPSPSPPRSPALQNFKSLADGRLQVSWETEANDAIHFLIHVDTSASWLAMAVSEEGRMVLPNPSSSVIGNTNGVVKATLIAQNPESVEHTLLVDSEQNLIDASFTRGDSYAELSFTISRDWVNKFDPKDDPWFIWAYGPENAQTFGYHGPRRDNFRIDRDLLGLPPATPASPPTASPPPPVAKPPPPPPPPSPRATTPITDYCSESITYRVAECYVSLESLEEPEFDDKYTEYANMRQLTAEYRVAWTVEGDASDGVISMMLQARTTGWVGFGLMGEKIGHGMINTDIWMGNVIDGVVAVHDTWSNSVAMPLKDIDFGHEEDLYDVSGYEENGITTLMFKRSLKVSDDWDYTIVEGDMPVVYSWSRQNKDALSYYHGPTRGFDTLVFIEPTDLSWIWLIALPIVGTVMLMIILFCFVDRIRSRRLRQMAEQRFNEIRQQVNKHVDGAQPRMCFGMALVTAFDFMESGKLVSHEELRNQGKIKMLDTHSQAKSLAKEFSIIFISHQWLSWTKPDPEGVHFKCIVNALRALSKRFNFELEKTYVWVDYCSIPQGNSLLQQLAISDLSEYAALASYFVVVVPPARHVDTHTICNKESYQARGWCRLEQFAKACTGYTQNMFICSGADTREFTPYVSEERQWKMLALQVLEGQFSCCQRTENHTKLDPTLGELECDKDLLKPALLRIYMNAIIRLPDCPLRTQLLENERNIFPDDRFDSDIMMAMREKFDECMVEKSSQHSDGTQEENQILEAVQSPRRITLFSSRAASLPFGQESFTQRHGILFTGSLPQSAKASPREFSGNARIETFEAWRQGSPAAVRAEPQLCGPPQSSSRTQNGFQVALPPSAKPDPTVEEMRAEIERLRLQILNDGAADKPSAPPLFNRRTAGASAHQLTSRSNDLGVARNRCAHCAPHESHAHSQLQHPQLHQISTQHQYNSRAVAVPARTEEEAAVSSIGAKSSASRFARPAAGAACPSRSMGSDSPSSLRPLLGGGDLGENSAQDSPLPSGRNRCEA